MPAVESEPIVRRPPTLTEPDRRNPVVAKDALVGREPAQDGKRSCEPRELDAPERRQQSSPNRHAGPAPGGPSRNLSRPGTRASATAVGQRSSGAAEGTWSSHGRPGAL